MQGYQPLQVIMQTGSKALMYMCELTFSVAMTVGAVKGAQGLTGKALGL